MKISIDLDDTLIPNRLGDFEVENRNLLQQIFSIEPLRKDTKRLFTDLKSLGHEVGIYTTSFRGVGWIKWMFWTYGIQPDFVINERISQKELKTRGISCSKFPPAFGIDVHIDDSKGVRIEGERYGFSVIVIEKTDVTWIDTIFQRIN